MVSLMRRLFLNLNNFSRLQNILSKSTFTPSLVAISRKLRTNSPTPFEIVDPKSEEKLNQDVIDKINNQIRENKQGRLFAVVHISGKQFKITEGDVIVVEGYWPPDVGDKISLDKVLLAGAEEFTLIGQPIVQKGLVKVEATVIEKTLTHTKTHFTKMRRKQYQKIHFYRIPQTYLRINTVEIQGEVNNPPEVRGLETAIF